MTPYPTIMLLNCENLFLFLDLYKGQDLKELEEFEWQRFSTSLYGNKPLDKTLGVAQSILKQNADIVMLTEVGGRQSLENFNKYFLDNRYQVYHLEGNSQRGIDLAYLVKKDFNYLCQIKSFRKTPLVGAKDLGFSRDVLCLKNYSNDNQMKFICLLVHLKSKLDKEKKDFEGRTRRKQELDTLIEIYLELEKQYPDTPIFVAGDFNGHAGKPDWEPEFEALYSKTDLEDICEILNTPKEERVTYIHFYNHGTVSKMQLDYLFVSKKFKKIIQSGGIGQLYDAAGEAFGPPESLDEKRKLPTDHYPLFCCFKLNQKN